MATSFRIDRDTLTAALVSMDPRIQRAVTLVMERVATYAESQLRVQAPWTDRTGNARAGLRAVHLDLGETHAIVLYHTMPYGFWLEVAHDGKYAVLGPVQRQISPQLEQLLQAAVARAMRGS